MTFIFGAKPNRSSTTFLEIGSLITEDSINLYERKMVLIRLNSFNRANIN